MSNWNFGEYFISEEFDELDIAANAFLFFVAGFETTASTLSYFFYELALNQDIQEKLRSEVQKVKDKNQTLTYESLRELTYMDAVISGKFIVRAIYTRASKTRFSFFN